MKRPLLAIVGPTASGKSAAGMAMAECFGGEIVNADPQQFYRGLDIGTAKPNAQEQARVRHHLLDILEPDERPALRLFQQGAGDVLTELWSKAVLPMLVGGSGQYIWGLLEGWTVPEVPPDAALRSRLEARAEAEGAETLHRELATVDPEAAARIDVNNVRRVIRALEVYERTGRPISSCQQRNPLDAETCVIGMKITNAELDERIASRTAEMFAAGLVDEVERLLAAGHKPDIAALKAIGYRDALAVLRGEIGQDEGRERTARDTRRLARRQMAWFKRDDPRINWVRWDDHEAMAAAARRRIEGLRTLARQPGSAEA